MRGCGSFRRVPPASCGSAASLPAGGSPGSAPSNGVRNIAAFEMAYVQAAVAGLIIILGALLIYRFVGQSIQDLLGYSSEDGLLELEGDADAWVAAALAPEGQGR